MDGGRQACPPHRSGLQSMTRICPNQNRPRPSGWQSILWGLGRGRTGQRRPHRSAPPTPCAALPRPPPPRRTPRAGQTPLRGGMYWESGLRARETSIQCHTDCWRTTCRVGSLPTAEALSAPDTVGMIRARYQNSCAHNWGRGPQDLTRPQGNALHCSINRPPSIQLDRA